MSVEDVEQGVTLIREALDRAHFAGPMPDAAIAAAETTLGVTFPASYRKFVRALGAGSIASFEIYGICDARDLERRGVPNAIWATLDQRKRGLPEWLVVIGMTGDGFFDVMSVASDSAGFVLLYHPAFPDLLPIADDFGTYFLAGVTEACER